MATRGQILDHMGRPTWQKRKPWNPLMLSQKVFGYRAGVGQTVLSNEITGWTDLSGNATPLLDPGAGKRPAYNATGGPNGGPCVTFDGVNDYLINAGGTVAQPVHIFLVAKYTASGNTGTVFDSGAGNGTRIHRDATTTMRVYAGTGDRAATGCTPENWHLIEVLFNGASSTYFEDRVQKILSATPGANSMGRVVLGIFGDLTLDPAACSIAEAWGFSAAVTGGSLEMLRNYFRRTLNVG